MKLNFLQHSTHEDSNTLSLKVSPLQSIFNLLMNIYDGQNLSSDHLLYQSWCPEPNALRYFGKRLLLAEYQVKNSQFSFSFLIVYVCHISSPRFGALIVMVSALIKFTLPVFSKQQCIFSLFVNLTDTWTIQPFFILTPTFSFSCVVVTKRPENRTLRCHKGHWHIC